MYLFWTYWGGNPAVDPDPKSLFLWAMAAAVAAAIAAGPGPLMPDALPLRLFMGPR